MTRDEMIILLKSQPMVAVTHELFGEEEYIYLEGNGSSIIRDENGYVFEDWYSMDHAGIRMRHGDNWETGWEIKAGIKVRPLNRSRVI